MKSIASIVKIDTDEFFYCKVWKDGISSYHKCDGIDGTISFIKEFFNL